jgi:hypothetical protein
MNSNDKLGIKGNLSIVLTDAQGNVKDTREVPNKVTSDGLNHILARLGTSGGGATYMNYMAIGTTADATPEDGTSSILKTEASGLTRVATTITYNTTLKQIIYVADFPTSNPSADAAVREAGIFSASTAGTLLCRTVFAVVNKLTTDSLRITWKITLTAP